MPFLCGGIPEGDASYEDYIDVPTVDLSANMDAVNVHTGKSYEAPTSLKRRFQEAGGVSGAGCREDDCACRPLE